MKLRVVICSLALAAAVALSLLIWRWPVLPGEVSAIKSIQALYLPGFDWLMKASSYIGIMVFAGLACAAFLASRGRWLGMVFLAASAGASQLAVFCLRLLVQRPRPPIEMVNVYDLQTNFAFPSGHVTSAVVLYGFIYYMVKKTVRPSGWQVAVLALLVVATVLVSISRLYLGAHWPSDILGGYLFGGLVLAGSIHLYETAQRRGKPAATRAVTSTAEGDVK